MELVTGRSGSPHITAQQDRQLHQGIFGAEAYILNTGKLLEPEVQSSNSIHIKDGALMFQGALFSVKVGTYDEVTINNGNQGMKRKDVIAVKYTYDSSQNIEAGEWTVVQGTPVASNPVIPDMPVADGDIQAGDSEVYCPVFVVTLDGINVTGVDVIPDVMDSISDLAGEKTEYYNSGLDHCIRFPGTHIQICFGTMPITTALSQNGTGYTGTANPNHKFVKPFSSLSSLQIGNADNNWFWIVRKLASDTAIQTVVLGYFSSYPSTTFYVDYIAIGVYSD